MNLRKPIIGITVECKFEPNDERTGGKFELNWNYANAISDAGGVPVVVPSTADMREIAEIVDGWLIPGGNDIDAREYGEENHPLAQIQDPARFKAEEALFNAIDPDTPVLGICYGCQFLNVVRGGSLVQHLPDVVQHDQHTGGTVQQFVIEPRSLLATLIPQERLEGKSYHHQAVKMLGESMCVVARYEDGTIEAIEAEDRSWMLGVQWHPERTLEDGASQKLFESFVAAAARFADSRRRIQV